MHNRRTFLKIATAVALIPYPLLCFGFPRKNQKRAPNIVLLLVDDFGWGDVAYRRNVLAFPEIDRLMREGMTFTDAYAASPTCSPSRASVLTGQHPARLRIVRHIPYVHREFHVLKGDPVQMPSRNWLPLEVDTFANALKQLGYRSAFIGKWHLGPEQYYPVYHGFDEQFGVTDYGYPRGYYPPYFPKECKTYMLTPKDKYLTDRLTDDAVSFIENHNEPRPFQLTLFYYGVHSPFQGRKDLVEKFKLKGLKPAELQHAAMVGAVDESVGRIREVLFKRGIADNTMILFLGDQGGPFSNKPLRGGKEGGTALYEGGARIPFIVYWPGIVSPGSATSELVLTTDVFPTILDAVGGKISDYQKLDGVSLMPLLTSKEKLNRDEIVLYRSYEDQYASIRSGKWKLIAYRSGKMELFDLENDLSEGHELSTKYPKKVRELKAKLYSWESEMGVEGISGCQLPVKEKTL